jgi:hypothetical protein
MSNAKMVPTELSDSFESPLNCDAGDELVIDEVDVMAELSLPKSLADRTCAESVNGFDHHGSSGTFVSVSDGASCFASGASLIAVQPDARGQIRVRGHKKHRGDDRFPVAGSSKLKQCLVRTHTNLAQSD